jgi:hypothetical protein
LVLASLTHTSKLVALAIAGHSMKHRIGKTLLIIVPAATRTWSDGQPYIKYVILSAGIGFSALRAARIR